MHHSQFDDFIKIMKIKIVDITHFVIFDKEHQQSNSQQKTSERELKRK
jgi:predicted nucleic-acid-binding protein